MADPAATVLLVEDSDDDVLLIRRAFARAAIANPLQVVSHGDAAIDYLGGRNGYADRAKHPLPMLILLDLKLPRRSGHEVLQWLRDQPVLRRTPVVVLTSSREKADIDRVYDIGANSYLVKPVHFDDLLQLARTLQLYWMVTNQGPAV